ncbi:redox-sensing transcriptional repressor Rex [Candidatus Fermentibacteria bacterium]|nr:MAG: redox-sensing transcriptional repressor Rex [Candidatus Fermentibacteria bacterium]
MEITVIAVKVSEKSIRRLSHYARCLRLAKKRGESVITSRQMAANCGISSAAVRRDLSIYGEFGKQGSGYNVDDLLINIENILGTTDPPSVIIVGAGSIGCALMTSGLAGTGGYNYSAIFDNDSAKIGKECNGRVIRPVEKIHEILQKEKEVIAVIAVTGGSGQAALDMLVAAGCKAILSFTLEPLKAPEDVEIKYVEVSTELDVLTHSMRKKERVY